jgi:SAM-dependent methyltransferase
MATQDTSLTALDGVDIMIIDQILKGRFDAPGRLVDVGCGAGRNLRWFLANGWQVFGLDRNARRLDQARAAAQRWAPDFPADNLAVADATAIPHPDGHFDVIISCAVLHFACNADDFETQVDELWRVLAPGGFLFTRLATTIGMTERMLPLPDKGPGWFAMPDGDQRFLVDEAALLASTDRLGATLAEPIKTTVVQDRRCMTTWCLSKRS